jgi:hypothetical protein
MTYENFTTFNVGSKTLLHRSHTSVWAIPTPTSTIASSKLSITCSGRPKLSGERACLPQVLYESAEPDLEAMSAGQNKLRMALNTQQRSKTA